MSSGAVVALLGTVLTASALDLALGILWVAALMGVLLLRRRLRFAPALVLLVAVTLLGWGGWAGWFAPPIPISYGAGWIPFSSAPPTSVVSEGARGPHIVAARAKLAALGHEELRLTGSELEQRAGAVIGLSRRLEPMRSAAPRETAAIEAASRRLARTLAGAEFRNLEARRAAAAAHLGELDRRLGTIRDENEAAPVLREADPVAMAQVSLRPVREDLAAAGAAIDGLVEALGGGVPTATTTTTARVDEGRGEIHWEVQYTVAGAPRVRLLRLETRPFRSAASSGDRLGLAYAAGGEALRPVPAGGWLELEPAPRGVTIALTWAEPLVTHPVHPALRALTFEEVVVEGPGKSDDVLVTAAVDGYPGIEIPLVVALRPPRLTRVAVPRHAFYFASRPGKTTSGPDGEIWEPTDEGAAPLRLELMPRTVFLRNPAFVWVSGYLYRPNLATVVAAIGLAALTLVLIRRPRPAAVANR